MDFLNEFVPVFKIASGEITDLEFLAHIASKNKPVILSTGASTESEVGMALQTLRRYGRSDPLEEWVALLHCVSTYPATPESVNLRSMDYMRDKTGLTVGWSNHVPGITICLAAAARGARIIEEHFTYRKEDQEFRDHQLSADPEDLRSLVQQVRVMESAIGGYWKKPAQYEEEQNSRALMRRGLSVKRNLSEGTVIGWDDLAWIRPATEIPAGQEGKVLGRRLVRSITPGELLREKDLV